MKRLIVLALLSLLLLSFDWGFPREYWKPVNTAIGFYYALVTPEYNYIAWDLIADDWKEWEGLKRDTFAQDCGGGFLPYLEIIDVEAHKVYTGEYVVNILLEDWTGYTLCVREESGKWTINCIWYE
jgi:hypothetical protein